MWDNSEMGSNLNDWINILATFILDIIKCHGLQTNDSEMNQRINHLVFILNLVKEGNNKQLCTVLQDLKTLLVGSDFIENAQIKQVSSILVSFRTMSRQDPFHGQVNNISNLGKIEFKGDTIRIKLLSCQTKSRKWLIMRTVLWRNI